jgi:hypothetical protein
LRAVEELIDDRERGGSPEDRLRQAHCAIVSPAAPRYQIHATWARQWFR